MNGASPSPTRFALLANISLVLLCSTILAACGPTATHDPIRQTTPQPTPIPAPRQDPIGSGLSFRTVTSERFNLSLPLPDPDGFRIDDRSERWFVATHPATSSTLIVRTWREYDLMNRKTCEERARLSRALPERDQGVVIEDRRLDVPPDHDTIVEVRMHPRGGNQPARGSVLAFGAWARQCFGFVFTTHDVDVDTVISRLSTIRHGTLGRMRFHDNLAPKRQPPVLPTRDAPITQ